MEIQQYVDQKNDIQNKLLEFIDDENNTEEYYQNLIESINKKEILESSSELQSILYIISKISNNHHQPTNFFNKIKKILLFLKSSILKNLTSQQIFSIFKSNKRNLLFLIKEKMLTIDALIVDKLRSEKYKKHNYMKYLYPEIKSFLSKEEMTCENPLEISQENFDEKRTIGENDANVCEMIRKDSIEEFITFVNQNNFSLKTPIQTSIFETNSFLLKNTYTLIEYSAFFGSLQILKYFHLNGIKLDPKLWIYAVHGDNPELIQYLEENKIKPDDETYTEIIKESIKCHHNEIVYYIYNNILNKQIDGNDEDAVIQPIKYHNYSCFPKNLNNEFCFYYLCEYDHVSLVKILLKNPKLNIKDKIIFIKDFTSSFKPTRKSNLEIVEILLSQKEIEFSESTFEGCSWLKEIKLPLSITLIDKKCFKGCSSLKQITIPSSVTQICDYAFCGCSSFTEIIIPSSVTKIGLYAFHGCSSLKQLSIPSSVVSIGSYAFHQCLSLADITIPDTVVSIGSHVFNECSSLSMINIPSSVTEIGSFAFYGCSSLNEITIPSSVVSIGEYTFSECSSLKEITIPSSVTELGANSFSGCSSLKKVSIDSSLTKIEPFTFNGCQSLEQISLPYSVTEIEENAFCRCSSLKQFSIPPDVTDIGEFAFGECKSLKKIVIPSLVSQICDYTFTGCSSLSHLSFETPSSVSEIGECAFKGCSSLQEVIIPSSVTEIKKHAFRGCTSMIEIFVPYSIEKPSEIGLKAKVRISRI